MTRIVKINKKHIVVYLISLLVLPIIAVMIIGSIKDRNKREKISNIEAARILMLGIASEDELKKLDEPEDYLRAFNETGCCKLKSGQAELTYSDVGNIFEFYTGNIPEQISVLKKDKEISRDTFIKLFFELSTYLPNGSKLQEEELTVAGIKRLPDGSYKLYTSQGIYDFLSNDMNLSEDKTYQMLVRDKAVLFVKEDISEEGIIEYFNVLLMNCTSKKAQINLYGFVRDFSVKGLDENTKNVLCNVRLQNGKIKEIDLKTDEIRGKVLSVTEGYVDIEGYGHVPLDEHFLMYDALDYETTLDYTGIVVGYSLQSFIVAEGRICGAVKEEELNADRIRVMLMTTGYKSLFHEQVVISSAEGFSVNSDEESRHFNGGEEAVFSVGDEALHGKRVRIVPDGTNKLVVKNINRSQGNPEYSGTLEVEAFDEGLVIVNDVNMEDYVSHVIPSEMPSSFGLEALKVQAVCARSYAYKELSNTNYSMYGAHVDDSVQYQVHNNTVETPLAQEAAKSTCGQLLTYNNQVVQTYYYSTSCGMTTDVSLWGSNTENYPFYSSISVGSEKHGGNLCSEEEFFTFITNAYPSDYDSEFPLYRWNMTVDVGTLGESIGAKSGCAIGNVEGIQVNKRAAGGAALSITITGSQGSVTLDKESQIRTVLGNGNIDLNTQSGTARYERLPSSFVTFAPVYNEGGSLSGFTIYGGGYGHGIGMSQNAVKAMSQTMDYIQILQFFYKDTQIRMASG